MLNYYSHQDDILFQMSQLNSGLIDIPTGTGKGEIIARHNFDILSKRSKKIKITVVVGHLILLSQQLLQREVNYFLKKKVVPNFRRICVHSGDPIEYGKDDVEEKNWLQLYPDDKCGSIDSLRESIQQSIDLGQDVCIATTYHSLYKIVSVLKDLKIKANVAYVDEIHRGVGKDEWFKVLKEFKKLTDRMYAYTATPGKQLARILSLVRTCIYRMDMATAIAKGLICKPIWMIVDVDGNKEQHLAKGVVTAFAEHQKRISNDAKVLVHCFDSNEIATIGDSYEIQTLIQQTPNLLVAEISSARGPRINGQKIERLEWLKSLNEHQGPMLVLHIDICNSGLDIPGFTFGLWTYKSSSETYVTQGNGRSGRVVPEDRVRLERGEISSADYSVWVKPHNVCGLLNFTNSIQEDEDAFVEFIINSREQGFNPEDIIYAGNKKGIIKGDPFEGEGDLRNVHTQSNIQVAIKVRLENEILKELFIKTKKVDPMNIFDVEI